MRTPTILFKYSDTYVMLSDSRLLLTFANSLDCYGGTVLLCPHNSILASDHVCRLLITFANSLDPDQDRQNIGPDLDPNHLTL